MSHAFTGRLKIETEAELQLPGVGRRSETKRFRRGGGTVAACEEGGQLPALMVTVALGTAAPAVSVTCPRNSAVEPEACKKAGATPTTKTKNAVKKTESGFSLILILPGRMWWRRMGQPEYRTREGRQTIVLKGN